MQLTILFWYNHFSFLIDFQLIVILHDILECKLLKLWLRVFRVFLAFLFIDRPPSFHVFSNEVGSNHTQLWNCSALLIRSSVARLACKVYFVFSMYFAWLLCYRPLKLFDLILLFFCWFLSLFFFKCLWSDPLLMFSFLHSDWCFTCRCKILLRLEVCAFVVC